MADEKTNLPSNHLSAQSRELFLKGIQGSGEMGFSLKEETRLSSLPIPEIRMNLAKKLALLQGRPLTRPECDACLKFLALTLPRAGLSTQDAHDMMDVYYGLLREAGVTGELLTEAAKAYVMRPNGKGAKFFPDPGQLAEICGPAIAARKKAIAAVERALMAINTPPIAEEGTVPAEAIHKLAERMRNREPIDLHAVLHRGHEIREVYTRPEDVTYTSEQA